MARMSTNQTSVPQPTWTGTTDCPFCGADLPDPGVGFVDHLDESAQCERGFDEWREQVAGDIGGEWTG